jgi:hypothetical protein
VWVCDCLKRRAGPGTEWGLGASVTDRPGVGYAAWAPGGECLAERHDAHQRGQSASFPRATPNGASFFLVAARARWDRLIAQKLRAIAHEVKTKRRDYQ